jgi:hypothetical protein
MTTSGSVNFSVSRDDIIQDALENLGVLSEGDTPSAAQLTQMSRKLNMIVKQWQGRSDFAPGLKLWARKTGYLFLQSGQSVYTLGPTSSGNTDKFATTYVSTTIASNEAAGQTVLSLTSATGISDTNRIAIELDSGAIQWTTVSGSPAGNDVTVAAALTGAAAAGNRVFAYATANQGLRPLSIISVVLRDENTNDTTLDPMLVEDYESISDKTADGSPALYHYETTLTDGTLYLDCEPNDVSKVLRIKYLRPIEDFDSASDTPDYPQEWYRPLCWQLTIDGAPSYGVAVTNEMKLCRDESLAIAKNANPETSNLYFQCDA